MSRKVEAHVHKLARPKLTDPSFLQTTMDAVQTAPRPLFGGAIAFDVPKDYIDAS